MEMRLSGLAAVAGFLIASQMHAAPPTDEQIRTAIKQLGDDRFLVRERAMQMLWNAGPSAEAALREASNDPDPEVVRRVRILVDRIAYRIEPDTPSEVVALMQKYKNGSSQEQVAILRDLLKLGSKSHLYLSRLLDAVEVDRRKQILDQFAYDDWKILATLVAEGREEIVEQLLDRAVSVQIESIIPHYAAFYSGSEKLKERISQLRGQVETKSNGYQARLLFALYRVANDRDGVLWAAEKTQQPEWVRLLLQERGDWGQLLEKYPPAQPAGLSQINGLGLLAAYQRLAGKQADFEDTVKKIEEYAAVKPDRANRPWYAAKALLVNEQPQAAMKLLEKQEQYAALAELLVAQGQYAEALALSEKAAKAEKAEQATARAYHIGLLQRAGEMVKAKEWLSALDKDMAKTADASWAGIQIPLEFRIGLVEDAEKHLAALLERNDGSYLGNIFAALYPNLAPRGETLWRLLRQKYPQEKLGDTLKRLRTMDNGMMPKKEFTELLKSATPSTSWVPQAWLNTAFEHIAQTVFLMEEPDLATAMLKDENWQERASTTAKISLADTLAQAKQWQAATDAYKKIWEQESSAPLPAFLHGWALTQLGRSDEGKKWMERAHRMILGSETGRSYFHSGRSRSNLDRGLVERGFVEDARREVETTMKLCVLGSRVHAQVLSDAVRLAEEEGRLADAATIQERSVLRYVSMSSGYQLYGAYGRVTSGIHIFRAKALLREGKKEEAFREIDRAKQMQPAYLELAIGLVAELERAGEKERAQTLFDEVYGKYERVCRDYPNCADAHNQLAWVAARCRRNLDQALEHSRKAVQLAPTNASYRDTLAEIRFQRGEKAEAIKLMKQCLKMPSSSIGYFHRQLRRFERGDPKEEPASEG